MINLNSNIIIYFLYAWYIPCEKHGCMITKPAIDAEKIIGKYSAFFSEHKLFTFLKRAMSPKNQTPDTNKIQS